MSSASISSVMRARKNIVTFYRAMAGLPVERQRDACHEAAKQLGAKIVAEYTAGQDGDTVDDWRRTIKPTDIAMVAVLPVLPDARRPGYRPSSALTETLTHFASQGTTVVVAMRGVSSEDGAKWVAEVKSAHDAVSGGRQLKRREAQRMARKSHEKRQPGVSTRWLSNAMTPVRERWASVWRDPIHRNAFAALNAMPDDVTSEIGSVETAYRIFGRRAPGDKSAGGRSRKRKSK